MPKKKEPELTPEGQIERFEEAEKEHEIEDLLPDIERTFGDSKPDKQRTKNENPPRGISYLFAALCALW